MTLNEEKATEKVNYIVEYLKQHDGERNYAEWEDMNGFRDVCNMAENLFLIEISHEVCRAWYTELNTFSYKQLYFALRICVRSGFRLSISKWLEYATVVSHIQYQALINAISGKDEPTEDIYVIDWEDSLPLIDKELLQAIHRLDKESKQLIHDNIGLAIRKL